jgi:antitoxin YefM
MWTALTFPSAPAILTRILVNCGGAMKTLSLSDAKAKLSGLVDDVSRRDEEVIITKNGRPAAVLVSADEYDSWQETNAVRSDAGLMREIKAGLRALKARKAKLYTLDELLK